ncbi:MAG: zinc ribbon domain-containing protein [Acidobacteria bacterium]|nr:zinc ribbon domain-containing protein [Acidobacteriota bacterium]
MYCSTCGAETTPEVYYCKRCGSSLNSQQAAQPPRPISLNGPSWAMALTIIFMVGIIFSTLIKMAEIGLSAVAITWIAIAGLGTIITLVALIFRQLSNLASLRHQQPAPPPQPAQLKPQTTSELYAGRPGALPEPVGSVTEHTTRTFAHVYREPVERQE